MKRHVWKVNYFFIKQLTKIGTSSTFLNSHQEILENFRKFRFSNFHLENSRTWIFTLWNHILQTQILLLQSILIYTYIYNNPPLGCNNYVWVWRIWFHKEKIQVLEFSRIFWWLFKKVEEVSIFVNHFMKK